ncbi:MAG: UPF0149 family protein [Pseudomonadales bacterium]
MTTETFDLDAYDLLDHEDLHALIETIRGAVGAAELHGMLTAELCAAGVSADPEPMLTECLRFLGEDIEVGTADRDELRAVMMQTQQALEDVEMSFSMLLPDDDAEITLRAGALAQWCQGFMYGFAVAEKKHGLSLSQREDVAEVLQDFAAISQVDADATEEEAANEEDLMHLTEYVRVAALNIYAQCAAHEGPDFGSSADPLTVH